MTITLTEIEQLEHAVVNAMAQPSCTRRQFNELSVGLRKLRAVKKAWLADHPAILRKLRADAAPKDEPNSPTPTIN